MVSLPRRSDTRQCRERRWQDLELAELHKWAMLRLQEEVEVIGEKVILRWSRRLQASADKGLCGRIGYRSYKRLEVEG